MHHGQQPRRTTFHSDQPAGRPASRSVLRSVHRSVMRCTIRQVLKSRGPTLREITSLLSQYLKISSAYEKKWNPPSRFKTLMTAEEAEAKWKSDIERAYGADACAARTLATQPSTSARASPLPETGAQASATKPQLAVAPAARQEIKHDVIAVPLVRLPSGICSLDWSNARPA